MLWTTTLWSPTDTRDEFYQLILLDENVGTFGCIQPEKSLKGLSQIHLSTAPGYLLVSCAKILIHTGFIFHIYLFWLPVYGFMMIFCCLQFPTVSVVFCCVTDCKHREAKECFIELFIVDNCTISLIVRNMVNISVWAEVAFISLCALNRDFVIFIKANSAVLQTISVSGVTVITTPNMI